MKAPSALVLPDGAPLPLNRPVTIIVRILPDPTKNLPILTDLNKQFFLTQLIIQAGGVLPILRTKATQALSSGTTTLIAHQLLGKDLPIKMVNLFILNVSQFHSLISSFSEQTKLEHTAERTTTANFSTEQHGMGSTYCEATCRSPNVFFQYQQHKRESAGQQRKSSPTKQLDKTATRAANEHARSHLQSRWMGRS